PPRGGRVGGGEAVEGAQEDARAAAAFGRELEPAGLDAREPCKRRDGRPDGAAAEGLGNRPDLVGRRGRAEQDEPVERNEPRQRRRVETPTRIGPENPGSGSFK